MNRFQALRKDLQGVPVFYKGLAITHCAMCSFDRLYVDSDYYGRTKAEHDILCAKCQAISSECADLDTQPCDKLSHCNVPTQDHTRGRNNLQREATWHYLWEILRGDLKQPEVCYAIYEANGEDSKIVCYGRKET